MTHTKGPWEYQSIGAHLTDNELWPEFVVTNSCGTGIASVDGYHIGIDKEVEANACLIASAPDLLEALELVHKIITEASETGFNYKNGDWPDRLFNSQQKTFKAIAKAKGEKD